MTLHPTPELPHDYEAEAALLGACILSWGSSIDDVSGIVTAADFHLEKNATIFEALADLHHEGGRVDLVRLRSRLAQRGLLEKIGGLEYLMELAESVPSAVSANHYAAIVREKSMLRRLMEATEQAQRAAAQSGQPVGELVDRLQATLSAIIGGGGQGELVAGLGDEAAEIYIELGKWAEEGKPHTAGLKTGLADLDRLTGGLQPGQLVVLAAGTGCGKSALALQAALNVAGNGAAVGFFSLEMTRRQLTERAMAHLSGVALDVVRGNTKAEADDFAQLAQASGKLADLPLFTVEQRDLTAERLRSTARWLRARQNVGLLVVDYLQLMRGSRRENRNLEVAELSRACKLLALELELPLLLLSQLNRDSQRDNRRPRLCDLRDSGAIESDADVVAFLYDPAKAAESPGQGFTPDQERDLELIIAKQRQGPTGCVPLRFEGAQQRFRNMALTVGVAYAY
jgi:replicative DNA helicase